MCITTKPKPIRFGTLAAALLSSILLVPACRADLISISEYNGTALPHVFERAGDAYGSYDVMQGPGGASASDSNGSGLASGGTGSQTADPSVFAVATDSNNNGLWSAAGYIQYAFEITGADVLPSSTAVIDVWSNGAASGGGAGGMAQASLFIIDANTNSTLLGEDATACSTPRFECYPTPQTSFTLANQQVTVSVGDVIVVTAEAEAGAYATGSWAAYVDPEIRLDPSDPAGLSLVFSPGIQQPSSSPVSSVPEPSTGALLSVGAALAACQLLRRRAAKAKQK